MPSTFDLRLEISDRLTFELYGAIGDNEISGLWNRSECEFPARGGNKPHTTSEGAKLSIKIETAMVRIFTILPV